MSTTSLMSFAEFEKLPDYEGKRELLHGEVIEMPPAKHLHARVVKELFLLLVSAVGPSRCWSEAGYRIGEEWLIPDVGVSWPEQDVVDGYMSGSPMIAIEVASPSNTAPQLYEKTRAYLEGGATEVWVAYPGGGMMVHRGEEARDYRDSYHCELLGVDVPVARFLREVEA